MNHKTDVSAVCLGIKNESELIDKLKVMVTTGEGGILSELRKDTVTFCMLCNKYEIKVAFKKLRMWPILNGYSNKKVVNIGKLVLAIFMLQSYAVNHKEKLIELEMNPLLVKSDEVFAADTLILENY